MEKEECIKKPVHKHRLSTVKIFTLVVKLQLHRLISFKQLHTLDVLDKPLHNSQYSNDKTDNRNDLQDLVQKRAIDPIFSSSKHPSRRRSRYTKHNEKGEEVKEGTNNGVIVAIAQLISALVQLIS